MPVGSNSRKCHALLYTVASLNPRCRLDSLRLFRYFGFANIALFARRRDKRRLAEEEFAGAGCGAAIHRQFFPIASASISILVDAQ